MMRRPNVDNHNPDPGYLRSLIDEIKDPELQHDGIPSQRKIAARLGINERTFRTYLTVKASSQPIPYSVQYCLEALAREISGN